MVTPASSDAEEFLQRVFPDAVPDDLDEPERDAAPAPLRGVDDRRQALLEPIGDPDRESW